MVEISSRWIQGYADFNRKTLLLLLLVTAQTAKLASDRAAPQDNVEGAARRPDNHNGGAQRSSKSPSEEFPDVNELWQQYIKPHPNAVEQYLLLQHGERVAKRSKNSQSTRAASGGQPACTDDDFCSGRCLKSLENPTVLSLFLRRSEGSPSEGPDVHSLEPEQFRNLENAEAAIFLILRDVALPLLCADEPQWRPCSGRARLAAAATLTQLDVDLDGRWGLYTRCPRGATCHSPERPAGDWGPGGAAAHCPPLSHVPGRSDISARFRRPAGSQCRPTRTRFADCDRPWEVWHYELSQMLDQGIFISLPPCRAGGGGGGAESTGGTVRVENGPAVARSVPHHAPAAPPSPASGGGGGGGGGGCGWRWVRRGKTVRVGCVRDRLVRAVEATPAAAECLAGCARAGRALPSESCYVHCFFGALLGNSTAAAAASAAAPSGGGGAPAEDAAAAAAAAGLKVVLEAWHSAFLNPAHGGCPAE